MQSLEENVQIEIEAVHLSFCGADAPEASLHVVTCDSTTLADGEQLLWLHPPLPTPSTGRTFQ